MLRFAACFKYHQRAWYWRFLSAFAPAVIRLSFSADEMVTAIVFQHLSLYIYI
jgi:hypothetical protein